MRYQDVTIRSIADLLRSMRSREVDPDLWYRGHGSFDWELVPTFLRSAYDAHIEETLVTRFMRDAVPFLDHVPEPWEWVFLMRHHGAPTRLLDWSESPLVGLYFAVANRQRDTQDGALWVLVPRELNRSSGYGRTPVIPLFGLSAALDGYLPERLWSEDNSRLGTVAGVAMRASVRMQAQKSVFTVSHRDATPIEHIGDGRHVWRYRIPADRKDAIRGDLKTLAISKLTVFPELDNVAELAREQSGV